MAGHFCIQKLYYEKFSVYVSYDFLDSQNKKTMGRRGSKALFAIIVSCRTIYVLFISII